MAAVELLEFEVDEDLAGAGRASAGPSLTSVMAESLEIIDSTDDFLLRTESESSSLLQLLPLSRSCSSAMGTEFLMYVKVDTSPLQSTVIIPSKEYPNSILDYS